MDISIIDFVSITCRSFGRLAQLVERNIDVVDARGSSPLSPTYSDNLSVLVGVCLLKSSLKIEKNENNLMIGQGTIKVSC